MWCANILPTCSWSCWCWLFSCSMSDWSSWICLSLFETASSNCFFCLSIFSWNCCWSSLSMLFTWSNETSQSTGQNEFETNLLVIVSLSPQFASEFVDFILENRFLFVEIVLPPFSFVFMFGSSFVFLLKGKTFELEVRSCSSEKIERTFSRLARRRFFSLISSSNEFSWLCSFILWLFSCLNCSWRESNRLFSSARSVSALSMLCFFSSTSFFSSLIFDWKSVWLCEAWWTWSFSSDNLLVVWLSSLVNSIFCFSNSRIFCAVCSETLLTTPKLLSAVWWVCSTNLRLASKKNKDFCRPTRFVLERTFGFSRSAHWSFRWARQFSKFDRTNLSSCFRFPEIRIDSFCSNEIRRFTLTIRWMFERRVAVSMFE